MRKKSLIAVLLPKTRRAVLAATVMHPEKWWFLADLARHIGVRPSSLQREMGSLVEAGVLLRRQEGKQVYFKPDPNCPILGELQGIMTKTSGLVDLLREILGPFQSSIKVAFVYGSIARCEEISESDVDLMIVGGVTLSALAPALQKAEEKLGRQVNPVVFSSEECAKKLKQGHHFLKNVVESDKLFLVGSQDDLAATNHIEPR
jgi:DNA-binding transcriptional ArsR family regulator